MANRRALLPKIVVLACLLFLIGAGQSNLQVMVSVSNLRRLLPGCLPGSLVAVPKVG
jgi:hypothetical protein